MKNKEMIFFGGGMGGELVGGRPPSEKQRGHYNKVNQV